LSVLGDAVRGHGEGLGSVPAPIRRRLWVVEVDDRDAALAWAAKLAAACRRPIEVRRFEDDEASVDELFDHLSTS
jgi:hypothetical protein